MHDLSLEMKNTSGILLQTQHNSTNAVLDCISAHAAEHQESRRAEFQALTASNRDSTGIIVQRILQEAARSQTQSTRINQKLEHISSFLEIVDTIREELRTQTHNPYTSRSDITETAQALFASLLKMWKSLDDVIKQLL